MPRARSKRLKYPEDWEKLTETLEELEEKMRDAELEPHDNRRKVETVWPVMRLHHQRSRYIWDMYKSREISRECYDFAIENGFADANLIAKWKKPGYEKLCCLMCVQTRDHNYGGTCVCRVPKAQLEEGKIVECVHCGCRGCASGD
jgi:bud site selection protein 31